jgi:hypothetical protein
VEDLDGVEQDGDGEANKYNWVVQIYAITTDLLEVQIHRQSQKEQTPTRKLPWLKQISFSDERMLTSISCLQSRKWRVSYSKMKT